MYVMAGDFYAVINSNTVRETVMINSWACRNHAYPDVPARKNILTDTLRKQIQFNGDKKARNLL